MGNPMPLHKRMESVIGTDAGSERAHRYRVMGQWKQKKLIRTVEPTRIYPIAARHKGLTIEVGPDPAMHFHVPSTADYPSEWLVASIMLALEATGKKWKWNDSEQKWTNGYVVSTDYQVGTDQLMHRALGDNGKYVTWYHEANAYAGKAADQMRKEIDDDLIHKLLYGDGKSLTTNTTLPPPVKRKP